MWTSSLGCLVRRDIAPKTRWKWFVQVVRSSCTTVEKSFSHHMSPSWLSMCLSSLKEFSFFIYPIRIAALMESFERYLLSRWYYYSATGIGTYIYTSTGKTDLIEEEDDWISFVLYVCLPSSSSWSVLYLHDMTSSSLFSQSVMLWSGQAYEGRPRRCPGNG